MVFYGAAGGGCGGVCGAGGAAAREKDGTVRAAARHAEPGLPHGGGHLGAAAVCGRPVLPVPDDHNGRGGRGGLGAKKHLLN